MKRLLFLIIAVLAIVGLVTVFSTFKAGNLTGKIISETDSLKETLNNTIPVPSLPISNTQDVTADYKINIINFAFIPTNLEIKVGESILWENKDSSKHTVTSTIGNELDSSELLKGETYFHKFDKVGTYEYYCSIHPYMKGKITVTK
ncbi:hypothetical protein GW932_00805 [archaeon]|nr:hypothetical protein [archaeon]